MCSEHLDIGGVPVTIQKKITLKNWYIRIIPPDGEVLVKVPPDANMDTVRLFVLRKMPDIRKIQGKMLAQVRQSKREYVSGESYYIWGKPYQLLVIYHEGRSHIDKMGKKLILTVPPGTSEVAKKKRILNWYRKEIKRVMVGVIARCEKRMGIHASDYRIKNMHTRWGTCNIQERRIWLNLQLAQKPVECLEYVVTHELVHLLEENHTYRFQALVEEFYPAWREAKRILETLPLDYMEKGAVSKSNRIKETRVYNGMVAKTMF